MILRGAAMATAASLGGAVFLAGVAAGAGLGVAAVGVACLARRAMKQRGEWNNQAESNAALEAELAAPEAP